MKTALRGLGQFLAICGITFMLLEIASRVFFHFYPSPLTTAAAWRMNWAHRARHERSTELYAPLEMHDPVLGWRNRPDFRSSVPLFGAERVTTNANGARGSIDYPYRRTDKKRIVVIGDSFAFGQGVNDEETYSALLGSSLADTEVINLGVIGYGIDQMLLTIEREALKYSPDLIIVGFISGDIERSLVSFRDFAKPVFVVDGFGRLTLTGTPVSPPEVWLANEWWRPRAVDAIQILLGEVDASLGTRRARAFDLTRRLWQEMIRVTQQSHVKIMFMFEPSSTEIVLGERPDLVARDSAAYKSNLDYFNSTASQTERFVEKLFLDFVDKEHVRSLNLAPAFRDRYSDGDRRIAKMGHWDAYGHSVAAAEIQKDLRANGWQVRSPAFER